MDERGLELGEWGVEKQEGEYSIGEEICLFHLLLETEIDFFRGWDLGGGGVGVSHNEGIVIPGTGNRKTEKHRDIRRERN